MDPLRKRFFVNGKPVAGSTLHAAYLKPVNVLLGQVKQRMQAGGLQQLVQRYTTEDGVTLTAMSRFGQDEIRIDVPAHAPAAPSVPRPELKYIPQQREIPGEGRVIIASGPSGRIYTVNRALDGLDLISDYIVPGYVSGIAAGRASFCFTERMGFGPEIPGYGGPLNGRVLCGASFFDRQWNLLNRGQLIEGQETLNITPTGVAYRGGNHYITTAFHPAPVTEYRSQINVRSETGAVVANTGYNGLLSGMASNVYGLIGMETIQVPSPTTMRILDVARSGAVESQIASLGEMASYWVAATDSAVFTVDATSSARIIKKFSRKGALLAATPLQMEATNHPNQVAAGGDRVYAIGWRLGAIDAPAVFVLNNDLELLATIDIPLPDDLTGGPHFGIGFDPYWRAGATIDDGGSFWPSDDPQ